MKRNVLNTVCAAIMMAASFGTYAQQRPDFTICNCENFDYGCTYVVMTSVTACNAVPTCISMPLTYTIAPGSCQGFAFTPPPGYTIIPSTVNFHVTNLVNSVTADFGYSSAFTFSAGNCHGTGSGDEVTTFIGNSHGTYTLCADIITGKPGGGHESITADVKASAKSGVLEGPNAQESFNIYPNPSSGDVTIGFMLKEAGDAGIEVYNSFHEKIYSCNKRVNTAEDNKVRIEGLTPGIYVLLFTSGGSTTTHKLMVKP